MPDEGDDSTLGEQARRGAQAMPQSSVPGLQRVSLPVAHVVLDEAGRVVRFNDLAARWLGLDSPHRGQLISELPCASRACELATLLAEVRETGAPGTLRCEHGGRVYALQASPYAAVEGARSGMLLAFTDLADLAPSSIVAPHPGAHESSGELAVREREWRQILDALPLMPFVIDATGASLFYGKQWSTYLGVSLAELHAKTSIAYVHPDDLELARHLRWRVLQQNDVVRTPLRWRRNDGEYRWFSVRSVPLIDAEGRVVRHFGVCVDVQEEHELREQLQATLYSLELSHQGGQVTSWTAPISYGADGAPSLGAWQPSPAAWKLLNPVLGPDSPTMERAYSSMHPDDRATVVRIRDAAVRALSPWEFSFRTNPEAGSVRWLLSRGVPVFEAGGRCTSYAGMLMDITAQKERDLARDETVRRLEHATKIARVGFFERDLITGRGWNDEQAAAHLGMPPGECDNAAVMAQLDPSELPRIGEASRKKRAARTTEFEDVHKYLIDGKPRWLRIRAEFEFLPTGDPRRIRGSYLDVTEIYLARERSERQREEAELLVELRTRELRQKQRHLFAVLEGVPCALAYWDRRAGMRLVNRAFLRWFGVEQVPLEALDLPSLWSELYGEPLVAPLVRALEGQAQSFEVITPADPDQEHVQAARAYLLPAGVPDEPDGLLLLLVDISDLKTAEQRAEAAARAKGQFLANMSHEIRTPLTAVVGFAELGARGDDGRRGELFPKILAAGKHLLTLIDDVLDFSRIEAGKLAIKEVDVELAAIELQLLDAMASLADAKGLTLQVREGAQLPRRVRSDGGRITQLLINLVSNALKFTEHGHVQVTLDYQQGALTIEVEDTGIGIPEETQLRLFEPFEQGVQRSGPRASGTGLGLAICKRIVKLMRGTLELRSTPEVGTVVRVVLPCRVSELAHFEPLAGARLVGLPARLQDELLLGLRTRGLDVAVGPVDERPDAAARCVVTLASRLPGLFTAGLQRWIAAGGRVIVLGASIRREEVAPQLSEAVVFTNPATTPLLLLRALEQASQVRELSAASVLAGVRVLVVEDNEINRMLLSAMLEHTGAQLVCAEDGEQALEQLVAEGPAAFDIVLCDIQMPGIDGYETTRRIKAMAPALPVVAVTANAYEDARVLAAEAGMSDLVTKPYDVPKLIRAIEHNIVRGARSSRADGPAGSERDEGGALLARR